MKEEITAGSGDLVHWATALPSTFWLTDTEDVLSAMTDLAVWSTDPSKQYRQEAVDDFLASADLKLIAHALVTSSTLVTREQPAPDSKKSIKIPDACRAFGVAWTDPFSAYRALGLRLVA